tara:strand:- start:1527 stop:3071 length:1545 start_codon:yes stop_codon:yes gene_type:complete
MKPKDNPKYYKKIVNLKTLKKILGRRPRKEKVILCHGNFDVVHPGHVRHLTYAKSKADKLIVSITADKFIQKGIYRPFVPQNIRAINIAAFEMVNYVIIDDNKKPLNLIRDLKPDYFAKGFEYNSSGLPPATKEEQEVVTKYGGDIIFTPGDIVYSSTKILNIAQPEISNFKLLDLMKRNKITFKSLREILNKLNKIKVHVIGDMIIDTYTNTSLIGGHTKTPTPSVLQQEKTDFVGGAGIVAKHLKEAGANVTLTTVLGNDRLKDFVLSEFKKNKIKINGIIDKTRPTTNKNTIISSGYKLLKIDKVDNQPISEKIFENIKSLIKKEKCDVIIFSDFRHGIFNKTNIKILSNSIKKNVIKVADSQVASRWGNILDFKKFDLITPNEKEVRFSLADQDSSISELTRELSKLSGFKNLILKLGERGTITVAKQNNSLSFATPSFTKNVIDAVGAGDALLAYASLCLASSKSIVSSNILGSIAAACECEMEGNIAVKKSMIIDKINDLEKSSKFNI